jgi:hypothetical protein
MSSNLDRIETSQGVEWLKSLRGTKWVSVEEGGREWPVGDLARELLAERKALVNVAKAAQKIPPEIMAMLPKLRKALAALEEGQL